VQACTNGRRFIREDNLVAVLRKKAGRTSTTRAVPVVLHHAN
jgi:hypothetical protein